MPDKGNRPRAGAAPAPAHCPDCDVPADLPEGDDPRRHTPTFRHHDECPIALAEQRSNHADQAWLSARPPGAVRVRALSYAEVAAHEQLGRPIPRRIRGEVEVRVTALAPRKMLRQVWFRGVCRGTVMVDLTAGAQR